MTPVTQFEYHSEVLQVDAKKGFVFSQKDVFQGISPESQRRLAELGREGWELVSVVPYSDHRFTTEAMLGFFKRQKS